MATGTQDKNFASEMEGHINYSVSHSALDSAIDWMRDNLDPDDVFDDKKLEAWAENNGYIKE